MSPPVWTIKWTETALVTIFVVAVGRRREGDRKDIYELARRLLRQRLIEP